MSLLSPQQGYLLASSCPLACRGHRQSRSSPALDAACPYVASKNCWAGGRSIICDSLVENWNMEPPRVVSGWRTTVSWCKRLRLLPARKYLLCPAWIPRSWRALLSHLPVPAQLVSAQMKVLKSCRTIWTWGLVCWAREEARKMNYFSIASYPVAAGWGETAEHVPVLAVFQYCYRKRILVYKGGSSPVQCGLGLPIQEG